MNSFGSGRPLGRAVRALLALLVIATTAACSAPENSVVLHTSSGAHRFAIEIADDAAERAQGLMFRTELADDAGMLFDYHQEQLTSFWMQNTLIPLDMIFISADGLVKTIHINARPLDTTSIPSVVPVRFVLEIAGGRSEEIGLRVGDRVDHPRIPKAD